MTVKPDDCVPPMLYREVYVPGGWGFEGILNPDRHPGPCRVYWGSHGCSRPIGHEGPHWCDCCECGDHELEHAAEGCVAGPPYYGPDTNFYGEDSVGAGR